MMIIGLEVPHTHIHLVPINDMADANIGNAKRADVDVLAATAEKIRSALG
jgi:histidine triad (HIT) family protein